MWYVMNVILEYYIDKVMKMSVPLYQYIKEQLIEIIQDQAANTPVQSERNLAMEFRASRMTVRRAINELVDEGYLYRDANKGTFVSDQSLLKRNTLVNSDTYSYKTLYFDVKINTENPMRKKLNARADEAVIHLFRTIKEGELPIGVEEIYIKRSELSDADFANVSKTKKVMDLLGTGTSHYTFIPELVPAKYASLPALRIGTPIIVTECLINTIQGRPLAYLRTYNNPENRVIEITS